MRAVAIPTGPPKKWPSTSIWSRGHPNIAAIIPVVLNSSSKYYLMLNRTSKLSESLNKYICKHFPLMATTVRENHLWTHNLPGGSLAFTAPTWLSSGASMGTEKAYQDLSKVAGAKVVWRMFTVTAALVDEERPPPSRADTTRSSIECARWLKAEIR